MAESTAERATAGFPWSLESRALIATAALRAVRDPGGGATLGLWPGES